MSKEFISVLVIAAIFLFSGKGGDQPSPRPDNSDDAKLAAESGRAYLLKLADIYEAMEVPETEAEFSKMLNEQARQAHNGSFLRLNESFGEGEFDAAAMEKRLDLMAQGFREVAE